MKYVIMVMMMAGVCVGQTVVDLPSSFHVFRSNEKLACVATPTGICYGPTADSIRECSTIPIDIDYLPTYWSILNLELDPQGRFVYAAVSYPNGLYRYNVENSEWEPIRPPTAGREIDALFVDRDGSVVIGTGGGGRRGIFRSADQGDTWAEVNTRDSTIRDVLAVPAIQSTSSGNLVVGVVYEGVSVQKGIFIQKDSGPWNSVVDSIVPDQLVVRGEMTYYTQDGSRTVWYVDLKQIPWTRKTLIGTAKRSTILPWNGDTIAVFLDDETDSLPPEVRLAVDGFVVDTISLEPRPTTLRLMMFGTDIRTSNSSRFIALGCGRNSIVSAQGADVGELAPGKRLALVTEIKQSPNWTIASVSGHGWYTIDVNGTTALDTVVGQELGWGLAVGQELGWGLAYNAYSEGWLKTTPYRLIDIRRTTIDTIVRVDDKTHFRCAVRREDGSLIAATHEAGLVEYIPSTSLWKSFSIEGLPDGVAGDSRQLSRISYIFEVDGELYVWAEPLQYRSDTLGGLYVFRSGWSEVDIPFFGSLKAVASDQFGVVLTVSGSFDGFFEARVAIRIQSGQDQPSMFGRQKLDYPLVIHAVCSGPAVTWITIDGDVFTSSDPNMEPVLVRSGLNSTVGRVGSRLLVATRDSGLFIYDATSSVSESDNNARVSVNAYPQPASSHVTFSTRNNNEHILRTDIYNVAGELVLSLPHAPSNTVTIATDALSSGIYLARIIATSASITLPISILAH
ncbi:MAG: T9SS type A sorting domain-containing protein [Ignavibacteria bacterium]|nr:T9SS type A sorting domain-containing protein [Ignavibacteria bacterium]MBK6419242.1 T9SS type A sorting domain-containing protein [Ignavibacteria bacterium]MBK7412145.1 T9SS type A sorting domain-containing protein [Ignavibacteria bacterium]